MLFLCCGWWIVAGGNCLNHGFPRVLRMTRIKSVKSVLISDSDERNKGLSQKSINCHHERNAAIFKILYSKRLPRYFVPRNDVVFFFLDSPFFVVSSLRRQVRRAIGLLRELQWRIQLCICYYWIPGHARSDTRCFLAVTDHSVTLLIIPEILLYHAWVCSWDG